MNKRFLSVILFAVVVSGLVSLLIYRVVATRIASKPAASATILVAVRPLPIGALVHEGDIKAQQWTAPMPPQAILKVEDVIGRGVMANIYEGEPIVESRLAPKGGGAGLAAIIPKGMRAVAVRVNEVVGVAGFVLPGMRVDVLVSGNAPGTQGTALGTQTRTVLQNLLVLSAGSNIQNDAEGKPVSVPVVNLAVTPAEAEVLSLAGSDTRIQLVLRNPLDNDQTKTPGTALAKLFGHEVPPAPRQISAPKSRGTAPARSPIVKFAPPPTPVRETKVIEVLHGAKRTESKFENASEVRQ